MNDVDQPNPYEAPATVDGGLVDPDEFFDGRLRTAALGLKIIYVGILMILVLWVGMIPVALFGLRVAFLLGILNVGILLGMLLINIGPLLCLTVPSESGLRPFAALAVAAQLVAVVSTLLSLFFAFAPTVLASLFTSFFVFLAGALFLLFLHLLARRIEREELAKRSRNIAIVGGLILFLLAPASLLIDFSGFNNAGLIYFVVLLFAVVFLFVAYANLVNALSDAIRRPHLRKPPVGIA